MAYLIIITKMYKKKIFQHSGVKTHWPERHITGKKPGHRIKNIPLSKVL